MLTPSELLREEIIAEDSAQLAAGSAHALEEYGKCLWSCSWPTLAITKIKFVILCLQVRETVGLAAEEPHGVYLNEFRLNSGRSAYPKRNPESEVTGGRRNARAFQPVPLEGRTWIPRRATTPPRLHSAAAQSWVF